MKLKPMERVTTQTLLGIQFWDPAINRPVSEGLRVRAQRLSDDQSLRLGQAVVGRATPSGVIAFFGLASEERADDDPKQQIWENVPVVIDLEDRQRRYLPMSFVEKMPYKGAIQKELWSAPSRPVFSALAVIRAQIVIGKGKTPPPAAYALVEAKPSIQVLKSSKSYSGMTDKQGTLLLTFPYPPVPQPGGSFKYPSLGKQTFKLTITVKYDKNHKKALAGSDVPNLEEILKQETATIITHLKHKKLDNSIIMRDLQFGQPLILRTKVTNATDDAFLRIQPT